MNPPSYLSSLSCNAPACLIEAPRLLSSMACYTTGHEEGIPLGTQLGRASALSAEASLVLFAGTPRSLHAVLRPVRSGWVGNSVWVTEPQPLIYRRLLVVLFCLAASSLALGQRGEKGARELIAVAPAESRYNRQTGKEDRAGDGDGDGDGDGVCK